MKNSNVPAESPSIVIRETLLNSRQAMSPLGRRLWAISRKIEKSPGFKPRSLEEIHRDLAIQNGEEDPDQDLR